MKTRNGFVSNSSSSSFCIYGTTLEKNYLKIFRLIKEKAPESFKELRDWVEKDWDHSDPPEEVLAWMDCVDTNDDVPDAVYMMDVAEIFGDIFGEDIDVECPYGYDGTVYIGRAWKNIRDNETGGKFKRTTEEKIKKILGNVEFGTHEEAWRDG